MPRTDDPRHAVLESEAAAFLESLGFTVASLEYHKAECEGLASIDTLPSHLIRTRADRHAFNAKVGVVVKFDAKTSTWTRGQQFAIEAVPFFNACLEAAFFGMPYVFVCRRRDGHEFGLLAGVEAANAFDKILVPEWRRNVDHWRPLFEPMKALFGAEFYIMAGDVSGGSGDPFVTVNSDFIEACPHWKDVFSRLTEDVKTL